MMLETKYKKLCDELTRCDFDSEGKLVPDPHGEWVPFSQWEEMRAELWNVQNHVMGPDKCLLEDVAVANREADQWKLRALDAEAKLATLLSEAGGAAVHVPPVDGAVINGLIEVFAEVIIAAYRRGLESSVPR